MAGRKPTDFTLRSAPLGDEEFYNQTLSENFRLTIDSIAEYVEGYIGGDGSQQNGTYLVSGGRVVWDTGLTFTVSAAVYYINGIRYESEEQTHTLAAADGSNPRFDTFYLDTDADFGAVTGTPAADPSAPSVDPETQIALTIAEIAAGATTPSNIVGDLIYDENVGTAGGEWDTAASRAIDVNFDSTDDPSTNTKHIKTTSSESPNVLRFTDSGTITVSDYENLVLDIKQEASFGSNVFIQFYWVNTGSGLIVSNCTLRSGQFGFNAGTTGYQTVTIPIGAFLPVVNPLTADQLQIAITTQAAAFQWKIDNIRLQGGLEPQQQPYEFYTHKNTLWVDGNGSDVDGRRGRFDKPFRTVKAAELRAVSGDTIIVMPGTYTESNLGKNGITYKLEGGATLVATGGDLFFDGGSSMTFNVYGGVLKSSSNRIMHLNNSNSIINFDVDRIEQTATGTSNVYLLDNAGTINGIVDTIINVGTLSIASHCGGGTTNLSFNRAESNDLFAANFAGEQNIVGNYLKVNCTYTGVSSAVSGIQTSGSGTINARINRYEYTGGDSGAYAIEADTASASTIIFTGNIFYEGTDDAVISANRLGEVILRNTLIEFADNSNNSPVVVISNASSKVTLDCCVLKNLNQGAAAHGISGAITSTAGVSNLDVSGTRILLHTTAVAAGAKAINHGGGALNYKAYSPIVSNGTYDGTNLIGAITNITDANAKSD